MDQIDLVLIIGVFLLTGAPGFGPYGKFVP
jgi:hypothetical protein